MEERRKYPRIQVRGLAVDIDDGHAGLSFGRIADFSRHGIAITELYKLHDTGLAALILRISVKDKIFRMRVKPRWCVQNGNMKTIGAEIVDVHPSWKDFVISQEPLAKRDVSELIQRMHSRRKPQPRF